MNDEAIHMQNLLAAERQKRQFWEQRSAYFEGRWHAENAARLTMVMKAIGPWERRLDEAQAMMRRWAGAKGVAGERGLVWYALGLAIWRRRQRVNHWLRRNIWRFS
jgi:hypothetical protein